VSSWSVGRGPSILAVPGPAVNRVAPWLRAYAESFAWTNPLEEGFEGGRLHRVSDQVFAHGPMGAPWRNSDRRKVVVIDAAMAVRNAAFIELGLRDHRIVLIADRALSPRESERLSQLDTAEPPRVLSRAACMLSLGLRPQFLLAALAGVAPGRDPASQLADGPHQGARWTRQRSGECELDAVVGVILDAIEAETAGADTWEERALAPLGVRLDPWPDYAWWREPPTGFWSGDTLPSLKLESQAVHQALLPWLAHVHVDITNDVRACVRLAGGQVFLALAMPGPPPFGGGIAWRGAGGPTTWISAPSEASWAEIAARFLERGGGAQKCRLTGSATGTLHVCWLPAEEWSLDDLEDEWKEFMMEDPTLPFSWPYDPRPDRHTAAVSVMPPGTFDHIS